jgi:hypothetical protein
MAYKSIDMQRTAWREHYARNKEYYAQRNKDRKEELRQWLVSLKEDIPCVQCDTVFHHKAMEWHHRDPTTKSFMIANAINRNYSKKRILEEIAKCDLTCANCHRIATF